jgi:hypothetical protein
VPLSFWFNPFLKAMTEIREKISWFLGELQPNKRHFTLINYLGLWSPSSKTGVETLSLETGPNSVVSGSWKAKVIGLSFGFWTSGWSFGPVDDLKKNQSC